MTVESMMTRPGVLVTVTDGADDGYGNPIETETETTVFCELQQIQRHESANPNAWQVGTFRLFLPSSVSVNGVDRFEVDGQVYDFEGPPWKVWNPRTAKQSHYEATVVIRS